MTRRTGAPGRDRAGRGTERKEPTTVWTQLLVLQVYPGKVLRVEVPTGRVETVIDGAGMFPDGVLVQDGVVYWTTMGAPETNPAKSGRRREVSSGATAACTPSRSRAACAAKWCRPAG